MSIEQLDIEFDDKTTIAIAGENGAGKSTVMAALAFLWSGYRKGDSYKDYIKLGNDQAHITHEAEIRGVPISFDVNVYDRKYGMPVVRKVTYQGQTYTNTEADELFKTFDLDYLDQIMFLFQDDNNIADLRPGDRAKLLKHLFHFDFESQVSELEASLEEENSRFAILQATFSEASKKKIEALPLLEVLSKDTLNYHKERLLECQSTLANLKTISTNTKTSNDILREISKTKSEIAKVSNILLSSQKEVQTCQELTEPQKPTEDLVSVKDALDKTQKDLINLTIQEGGLVTTLEDLKNNLTIALSTNTCHTCGGEIDLAHQQRIQKKIEDTEQKLFEITQSKQKVSLDSSRLKDLYKEAQNKQKLYETHLMRYNSAKESIPSLLQSIESNESLLAITQKTLDSLTAEYNNLLNLETQMKPLLLERDSLLKESKDLELAISNANRTEIINQERVSQNRIIVEEKRQHEERLDQLRKDVARSLDQIETLKKAISLFKTEFPNYMILSTCGHIESYINTCIQKVFPYMKVKLQQSRSGVEFYYTPTADEWLSVKMASGAERAILALSWRIAIAKLYGLDTILFDEIDSSMTDDNSKTIYEFIASLETFNQVLLISHRKAALRAINSLADNVTCYWVHEGVYDVIDDPESL